MALNFYDSMNSLSGGQLPSIPFRGKDNAFSWGNIPNIPNIPTKLSDVPSGLAALQSTWANLPPGIPNLPRGLPFFSGRLPDGLNGSYKFANRLLKGEVVGPGSFNPATSVFRDLVDYLTTQGHEYKQQYCESPSIHTTWCAYVRIVCGFSSTPKAEAAISDNSVAHENLSVDGDNNVT